MAVVLLIQSANALGQTHVIPMPVVGDSGCVASVAGQCILRSPHRLLEVVVRKGEGPVAVFTEAGETVGPAAYLEIKEDLLTRVDAGDLTPEEAQVIVAELNDFDGPTYILPMVEELKAELGFPAEAEFVDEDLREIVRAHLQISLGIGPITAAYLSDRMGIELISANTTESPNEESASF